MAAPRTIALFDIDGTLTPARLSASPEMQTFLQDLRKYVRVGVVGGSDFVKQKEQLGDNVLQLVDYSFSENGLVAYKGETLLAETSITSVLSEGQVQSFVDWNMNYIKELDIPVKTSTFVEVRTGMFNISPIGRDCTYDQRLEFLELDKKEQIRKTMCEAAQEQFPHLPLQYAIGGQISFDVFPTGWTKVYCLRYLENDFDAIHFFGDMTMPGGNDADIFNDRRVIGHTVKDPEDTMRQCREIFFPK
jgi:phosphomannomutase